jgi:hypothetical protein
VRRAREEARNRLQLRHIRAACNIVARVDKPSSSSDIIER